MYKHHRKLFLGVLLLILTGLFIPGMAAAQDQGPTDPAEITAFFEGLMHSYLKANHIPGAAVAIVKNGAPAEGGIIFSHGYGYANVETRAPVDPATTLFRAASSIH
jgi:CubicO group peptidase (beta-lactamase class C family)